MAICLAAGAVTLNVTVPDGTPACYVAGAFNGWSAGGALSMQKSGENRFTLTLDDVTQDQMEEGYKYLSGPDWQYVEKGASGEEISNRTSVTDNDVVARWAKLYMPNFNLDTTTLRVNGYDRKVEILLPEGYAESTQSYPVVYYVGVQQRYSAAGSDDAGDNFFGSDSWNVAARVSDLPLAADNPCIFVATYSFVAENIPYSNPDFMGSGQTDAYLSDFITTVVGYVNSHYRTLTTPDNTTIIGADLGGVTSLYAALSRPDCFGRCVSMSPMLWINRDEMLSLALQAPAQADILITYGTAEATPIYDDVCAIKEALPTATVASIANGLHDDTTWGSAFSSLYPFFVGQGGTVSISVPAHVRAATPDIANTSYQLYSAVDSQDLQPDNNASFTLIDNFVSGNTEVAAQVLVRDIPVSVKTKYYWNVARLPGGDFLLSSPRNIGFSSKKSSVSWHRVAILSDETVKDIAASSTAFTVQNADGKTKMAVTTGHCVKADVPFTKTDKSFTIHYGSVNSGSDMGAITSMQSVSAACTAATVEYDFLTNGVTVTETAWGDVIDKVNITTFSATPAVTAPGTNSLVRIQLDELEAYDATLSATLNYGTPQGVTLTQAGTNCWEASLNNLSEGIYHLSLNLTRGNASKQDVAQICIKVLAGEDHSKDKIVTVNAYDGIDWGTINRYKANFHTHTSQSFDCNFSTTQTVDSYRNAGYKILALTDHDANPYPWTLFELFNPEAAGRNPEEMGMLAIPGVELSKDKNNTWNESTGGEFNHHNDFFTGRKGQEFGTLRESYAYTNSLGGMQIINHPGQYWSLDREYTPGEKNSPEWHVENFMTYPSLVGLEVYNQGNRRPNDRILWDQILDRTMPGRPVWGYSCDDTHTAEQYFRNYEFMLMPELTVDALKDAMRKGALYFSYEFTGSGNDLAPHINSITVDNSGHFITVDSDDADEIVWIAGTDRKSGAAPSTRKSTIVGIGKTFDTSGFRGSYVRALLRNEKGETCTQPFGFTPGQPSSVELPASFTKPYLTPNPASGLVDVKGATDLQSVTLYSMGGMKLMSIDGPTFDVSGLQPGVYLVVVDCAGSVRYTERLIVVR